MLFSGRHKILRILAKVCSIHINRSIRHFLPLHCLLHLSLFRFQPFHFNSLSSSQCPASQTSCIFTENRKHICFLLKIFAPKTHQSINCRIMAEARPYGPKNESIISRYWSNLWKWAMRCFYSRMEDVSVSLSHFDHRTTFALRWLSDTKTQS